MDLKRLYIYIVFILFATIPNSYGQSIHFSQYYNAPLLENPANTALMSESDYRLGLNFRNQWAAVPVPYNTFSGFTDFKVGGNRDNTKNNWLGIGFSVFNDKAGDGNLSLLQIQGSLAYHLQLSEFTMISVGFSGAKVSRSVNYDMLIFDAQWDGATFDRTLPTGEKVGVVQTSYSTIGSGINFAWFPNEFVYIKLGGGVANINQPTESFYAGTNKINYRPTGNLDMLFNLGPVVTLNPSIFYATQNAATEIIAGSLVRTNLSGEHDEKLTQLILGGYMRMGDAVIGVAGFQWGNVQFMANYDFTISTLAPYNAAYGALEMSLIYTGIYGKSRDKVKKSLICPRF